MEPIVLRLLRVDHPEDEADFVLVHVSSAGENPLDLKLIGTDGENVFSVSLKASRISSLKAKKSKISEDEWETVLSAVILGTKPDAAQGNLTEGVEAVAKLEEDTALTLIIQKRIEGITQQLGVISIPSNDDEVAIYEWCGQIIQARDSAIHEVGKLRELNKEKDKQIARLEEKFAEIVKLKADNESQLLEKFSLLLNQKKLKIRDQQRLLASSKAESIKSEEPEESELPVRSRIAGPSRGKKRKAEQTAKGESEESDDGFEKMDVDEEPVDDDSEQAQTPEASTAEEDTAGEEPVAPPPTRKAANIGKTKGNGKGKGKAKASRAKAPPPADSDDDDIPPKRTLPFFKGRKSSAPAVKPAAPAEGSETESDDEL